MIVHNGHRWKLQRKSVIRDETARATGRNAKRHIYFRATLSIRDERGEKMRWGEKKSCRPVTPQSRTWWTSAFQCDRAFGNILNSIIIRKINTTGTMSYVINSDNLRTVTFLGTNPRSGQFSAIGRRSGEEETNPALECTEATHSWANKVGDVRRDAPCAYIDGDAEGPFSLSHSMRLGSICRHFIRRSLRFPGSRGCTWSLLVPVHSSPLPRAPFRSLFGTRYTNPRHTDMLPWTWIGRMDTALEIGSIAEHPAVGARRFRRFICVSRPVRKNRHCVRRKDGRARERYAARSINRV